MWSETEKPVLTNTHKTTLIPQSYFGSRFYSEEKEVVHFNMCQTSDCTLPEFVFIPSGHSKPDWRGASSGSHQLLSQLHGPYQVTKEKVRPGL